MPSRQDRALVRCSAVQMRCKARTRTATVLASCGRPPSERAGTPAVQLPRQVAGVKLVVAWGPPLARLELCRVPALGSLVSETTPVWLARPAWELTFAARFTCLLPVRTSCLSTLRLPIRAQLWRSDAVAIWCALTDYTRQAGLRYEVWMRMHA
jgi:hypothetical protein